MNKDEQKAKIWNAFVTSGKPGYYLLYKAIDEEEEDNGSKN